jgi:hypothetical protein
MHADEAFAKSVTLTAWIKCSEKPRPAPLPSRQHKMLVGREACRRKAELLAILTHDDAITVGDWLLSYKPDINDLVDDFAVLDGAPDSGNLFGRDKDLFQVPPVVIW